jgi:hemerythrin-like domain-containing protein
MADGAIGDRRDFLALAAGAAGGLVTLGALAAQPETQSPKEQGADKGGEEEVSPAEDLMREHGVLKRVILVYREGIGRLEKNEDVPPDAISDAAKLIRTFIEDYHEKLEEDHLFPRFRKANTLVDLVDVLTEQHQAGRRVTDTALQLATASSIKDSAERRRLIDSLSAFIRMYEPHEAREDTVLFPALHRIVSRNEYDALGEDFERIEHDKLGEHGFERAVEAVAAIEKRLGIYDLGRFTPR